ncbi:MAG: alcohol dehydrogenase catalytic domain-containing protein [Treponema sp.]|jgi:L-iditol 2-dehydrogenase|nr:alcohol dehydrogenase catalytic domain-containing protein [Treponema sp.]
MKRLQWYGIKDLRLETDAPVPQCEEGGVLVKTEAFSVCGTDIKAYNAGNNRLTHPQTVGHEFVGRIEESKTPVFKKGDRVVMAPTIGCGVCYYCKAGRRNLCAAPRSIGFQIPGAMAEYLALPPDAISGGHLVSCPDDIPAPVAAIAEPLSCVVNGLSRAPVSKMQDVLIIGLGAIGLLHAIAIRSAGVKNIVTSDFAGQKAEIAKALGFTVIRPEDLDGVYREYSGGLGFELVVIAAPVQSIQEKAPSYARKGGYVSYFASLPPDREKLGLSSRMIHYNELVLYGTSDSTPDQVKEAVKLLQLCKDEFAKMITVLPMEKWLEGYQGVMDMKYAKVVLTPRE